MRFKFRESLSVAAVGSVDREQHVIRGVKVCGLKSGNGRDYSRDALRNATHLYEGCRVFFDHPEGKSNTRRFRERFGRLVNVKVDGDGMTADLRYNPKHPDAEQFLYLAENDPAGMGLSHNAEGSGRRVGGKVLVESISKVHSVDIVDNPATVFSLYEQQGDPMEPLTDPAAPAADATGGDGVEAKLQELIGEFGAHPELTKEDKIKKIKAVLDLLHDGEEDESQAEDAPEGDAEPAEDEMMEQLGAFKSPAVKAARKRLLREQRRKAAAAKGLKPELITETFLEQLVDAPAGKIDRLIDDRKAVAVAATVEKPRNGGPGAKPLTPAEIAKTIDWNS
jgi:hypothetical protein